MKIYIYIILNVNYDRELMQWFNLGMVFLLFMQFVFRYSTIPYFNSQVATFNIVIESLVFYLYLVVSINAFIEIKGIDGGSSENVDNNGFVLMIIGSFGFCYTLYSFYWIRENSLIKKTIINIKTDSDCEYYIIILMGYITRKERAEDNLILQGMLKTHKIYCQDSKDTCPCDYLFNVMNENQSNSDMIHKWN